MVAVDAHPAYRRTHPAYRRSVARLLVGLVVFGLIYLGLIAGCVAAIGVALTGALREPMLWPVAIAVALVFGPMLAFLLHGVLRRPRLSGPSTRIDARAHPRLLACIEALAREVGIAVPMHVSLGAGVNAAMIAGVGHRELVVGLGLVNVLDVRELEAVLAHEFGHFGQSSMRLGQWASRVTLVLRTLVLGRSRLDAWLTRALGSRWLPVRALASITAVGVRGLRGLLGASLTRLTRLGHAFSRELEFNADLHAVALRGSDPLVSALWRAQRGALAMNAALARLAALARHGIHSDDVYAHQLARLDELDDNLAQLGDPMSAALRRPYRWGPGLHFPPGATPAEVMWYAHPSYAEREANAKQRYVIKDASPSAPAWSLFEQPERLRRDMSALIYGELAGGAAQHVEPMAADEVEARLADELAERQQGAHYHGFYDNRLVDPGDLDALIEIDVGEFESLTAAAARWRGDALELFMARWREQDGRLERLRAIASGRLQVARHEAETALEHLRAAEQLRAHAVAEAHEGDRAVFLHAWALADVDARPELLGRYRFLQFVQRHIAVLNGHHAAVQALSRRIDTRHYQRASHAPVELLAVLDALHRDLAALLEQAGTIPVPRMRNIDDGRMLVDLLLRAPLLDALDHDEELDAWLRELMMQVGEVHQRLRTLHYKNLGQLLSLHERIEAERSDASK